MGIPYYVASLAKKNPNIQTNIKEPIDVDILGIDFNCFIHTYLSSSNPIGSIMVALHELTTNSVRAKRVYIAFDGLVPMAKMVQQRYRRFRKPDGIQDFDKHQISPGTPYMKELASTIRFMFPEFVVSDTLERGEGEHKIFLWLRTLPENTRKNVCIYGLDADLVLISLAQSHLGSIRLFRDDKLFSVDELKKVLPMDLNSYIRMCIMCFGNDFMPNLAMFSLREDGYTRAIHYADKNSAHEDEIRVLKKRAPEFVLDGHAFENRFAARFMDGVLDWQPVCYAFWKTFAWTLHYFTTSEVLDWEWYYPYPEAPLLSTINDFEMTQTFEWDTKEPSYTIEDQLAFILPEASLKTCGLSAKYPDELYDEETETRIPWMRRYAWEADPYISLPRGQLTSAVEVRLS